ncbi:MAG: FadR/GntR family transcriptional regulator [Rhizobiaceae bacterium]
MSIFSQITSVKTADEVAHQIEALVLEGVLRVGDQLPGERELANTTGVSRPTVREGIKALEARGILESHHGGGTFVSDVIGTVFSPQIISILPAHKKATRDYLEFRHEFEGSCAAFAALRATTLDRELFSDLMGKMELASNDPEKEGDLDVEFHSLIGEMAHNLVMLHTMRSCYRLLSAGVFENRERLYSISGSREKLLQQHRSIYDAIMARNPEKARLAAQIHIDFISEQMILLESLDERERIAKLRSETRKSKTEV